jgi:hypothetical protein
VVVNHELNVAHNLGVATVSLLTDFAEAVAVAIGEEACGLGVEHKGDC